MLGSAERQEHENQVGVDPGTLGSQHPAPRPFVHLAEACDLLAHGQTLRMQMRPCGLILTYGTDTYYTSCPVGVNPWVWLRELARRHRTFERQERLAGRGPLSARLRVVRFRPRTCRTLRGRSRKARRSPARRSARHTRAGPARPAEAAEPLSSARLVPATGPRTVA